MEESRDLLVLSLQRRQEQERRSWLGESCVGDRKRGGGGKWLGDNDQLDLRFLSMCVWGVFE